MTSPVEQVLLECLHRYQIENETLIVGISGGLDSVTLVHALCRVAPSRGIDVVLAHVNHKLRLHHSDDDAAFVSLLAQELSCSVHVIEAPTQEHPDLSIVGTEAAARSQRYEAFSSIAHEHHARFVLTAHSLEDNVETFLMNAARGSGFKGLAAIPELRSLDLNVRVLRPLLECTRGQIRAYAEQMGLLWREDHTNDTLDYTRNRVRKVVLPALEQALGASSLQGIHNAATHLRALRDAVEFLILPYRSAFSGDVSNASSGPIAIAIDPLKPLTMSLRALIIQHYLALSREDVGRLSELVDAEVGSRATLSQGMMALRDRASISVEERAQMDDVAAFTMEIAESRTCTHNGSVLDIELGVEPSQEYSTDVVQFDIKDVHLPLVWRTWKDGDRLAPFGMDGKTCLVSDVITNARIAHEQRRSMQVLTDSRGILWICGLRRSNRAPVTEETTRVLRCRYRSPST